MISTIVRVFVASPGDVAFERNALGKLVAEINQTLNAVAPERGVRLELVRWETHAIPEAGRPQGVINRQIGKYDIFVGIMWRRFGTATTEAGSGTEEEFDRAYKDFQDSGRPHIMFYFCQAPAAPPKAAEEVAQLGRVVAFRDKLSQLALVWEYEQHSDFADTVRPHLLQAVNRVIAPGQTSHGIPVSVDKGALTNLRHQLIEYAAEYAHIRKALDPGDKRTRQLELIATKIRTLALEGAPLLADFIAGTTPGERLVAAVFLQVTPNAEFLNWLGDRLGERQPFLGYHAAVGLLAAARNLDCSHSPRLESAIRLGLKRLGPKRKTDRYRTLQAAKQQLHSRCGAGA